MASLRKDCQVRREEFVFEQEVTKVTKGGNAGMQSGTPPGRVSRLWDGRAIRENMFTTEGTEITENNRENRERFGRSVGKLAGFAKKARQVAGNLWNGRVHAKIAELSERTRGSGWSVAGCL